MKQTALIPSLCALAASVVASPPNIVLIVTDDQNIDSFGAYGANVHTPNIDQLASEGVRFDQAYAITSVCSPSRYAILTGRYPGRCTHPRFDLVSPAGGIARISNKSIGLEKDRPNLVRVLKQSGYTTGIVGKWHLGKWMAGWKQDGEWRFPPGFYEMGLQEYPADAPLDDPELSAALAHNQEVYRKELSTYGWDFARSIYWCNPRELHHDQLFNHNQEWLTAQAVNFIDQQEDAPFFLYLATTIAHSPDPQDTLDRGDDPRGTGAGWTDAFLDSQPLRTSLAERVNKAGAPAETAYLTWLDDGIGAILKALEEKGVREDTLVILTSDHGLQGKATLYESGVHVPLFFNWPGRINPGVQNEPVQHLDLFPTLLELANIEPDNMILDGQSLAPLLSAKATEGPGRDSLYFEYGYARAVRRDPWKYITVRYPEGTREAFARGEIDHLPYLGHNRTLGRWQAPRYKNYFVADQLYHLGKDPMEENNLADNPRYAEVLGKMKAALSGHLRYAPERPYGELKHP